MFLECSRLIFPLLTVYIILVCLSSSSWKKYLPSWKRPSFEIVEEMMISKEATTTKTTTTTTNSTFSTAQQYKTHYFQNVSLLQTPDTNSPPYFDFIYSEPICLDSNPYVLILVASGLKNRRKRDVIRKTWGRIAKGKNWPKVGHIKGVRLVFLLGQGQSASLNLEVLAEARATNDIVIGGFSDTYRNLTNKILMGFKWIKIHCPGAQYVMKTDDDSFLDIPKIIDHLKSLHSNNTITGYFAEKEKPIRDNSSKYYVSETEYPLEWYPPHVKGCMYVIPIQLVFGILNSSQHYRYLSMEDVFITGVVAEHLHPNYSGIPDELYAKNTGDDAHIDACRFIQERKVMAHHIDVSKALHMWNMIEKPDFCMRKHHFKSFQILN